VPPVLRAFVELFVVIDVIGTLPIFLALTRDFTPAERRRSANVALAVAGGLMLVFLVVGDGVLALLRVELSSFRIAGGLILGILGLQLVLGQPDQTRAATAGSAAMIIGTPLLTGPGTISTIILLTEAHGTLVVLVAALANLLVAWAALLAAGAIARVLGANMIQLLSRVMGLLLLAIAVQYVRDGIAG
jgi:multiple antibiotic resistance protein